MSDQEPSLVARSDSIGSYRLTFENSVAPFQTSRLVTIIRKHAERTGMADALFHLMRCLMNGLPSAMVNQSQESSRYGTVDWLFREYKQSKAYLKKVAPRSRPDYERTMLLVSDMVTKKGDRIGDRKIKAISPVSADKIYELIVQGPNGARPRQGEKAVTLCRRAWRVVHRLYPDQFDRAIPNPWDGVTKDPRAKKAKAAVNRELVYRFAWGCIEHGQPEAGAAAVICFEWLQRPENVLGGYLRWTDYRSHGNSKCHSH